MRQPPRPVSIRDIGLKQHIGAERYAKLEERLALGEPKSVIAKALGISRNRLYTWLSIYHEEHDAVDET